MNTFNMFSAIKQPRGMGLLGIFFILILFLILIFFGDMAFIFFSEECLGQEPMECIFGMFDGEDDAAPAEGAVTATGALSGEFNGEEHSVTVSMSFPLEGGEVTGSFSGDCDGSIKGTYAGGGGAISGKGSGSCGFVVPASGSFSGSVNEASKSVNINGSGSALGITKTGSMSLGY